MEAAARGVDGDIQAAQAALESIRNAARDPYITQEELALLNQDENDWIKVQDDETAWKDYYWSMARAAKLTADGYTKMIEAGDQADKNK
jgi:hypothetical protein